MKQVRKFISEASHRLFLVSLNQTGEHFPCAHGETLLQGMLRLGRRGIPVGCVNGGCGVCKIRINRGNCRVTGAVSREHVSETEAAHGITLACRATPETDVEVEVIGKMQRSFLNQLTRFESSGRC